MKKTFTYILLVAALMIFGKVSAQTTSTTGGTTPGLSSTPFGNGFWNVYCYNGHLIPSTKKPAVYRGFYTETEINFNSTNRWSPIASPTTANTKSGNPYSGSSVDSIHTISYKRTGFVPGVYQIDIAMHDNSGYLLIDGIEVWKDLGCCHSNINVWSGMVLSTTTIEFKWINFELGSRGALNMIPATSLPVTFIDFTSTQEKNSIRLSWSTASETNNDYFTVEKSTDGIVFNSIDTIKGSGNSNSINTYSALDEQLASGKSYYRIKQTDFNQNNTYSMVICINYTSGNKLTVCPNPGNSGETVYVSLSNENNSETLIVVRDMQGQEYYSKVILDTESHQLVAINPQPALAPGMYMLVASSDNNIYSQKIIIR